MITLTKSQQALTGKDGSYYRLSPTVGVKILHSKPFGSQAKAHKSYVYRQAVLESTLLTEAYESGYVPRCYGPTVVKLGNDYRVGVLMQHLGGKTLSESEFYDDADIYTEIRESLKELGIYHNDLNEDNIMVYRGKFYAVDFSPSCVKMKE